MKLKNMSVWVSKGTPKTSVILMILDTVPANPHMYYHYMNEDIYKGSEVCPKSPWFVVLQCVRIETTYKMHFVPELFTNV